jgi:hypothetical protein
MADDISQSTTSRSLDFALTIYPCLAVELANVSKKEPSHQAASQDMAELKEIKSRIVHRSAKFYPKVPRKAIICIPVPDRDLFNNIGKSLFDGCLIYKCR